MRVFVYLENKVLHKQGVGLAVLRGAFFTNVVFVSVINVELHMQGVGLAVLRGAVQYGLDPSVIRVGNGHKNNIL